jgi:hypothetical protein
MSTWSKKHIEIISDRSLDRFEAAVRVGRTPNAVHLKRQELGIDGCPRRSAGVKKAAARAADLEKDREAKSESYWKSEYKKLNKQYNASLEQLAVVDRLVAAVTSLAPLSYSPAPHVPTPARPKAATPESAVLLFSDTHIGKRTRRTQTLGFSQYDFPTFLARLKFLEKTVISILRDHTNAPLNRLVVAMLGDMLDGALSHGVEAGQVNVLFNQFYQGAHAIAQFLRNIAAHVPEIQMETTVGNHTRWQNQKKMPTENRFSNMDMFLYAMLESLTADIPNIKWNLSEQPFAVFNVEGFTLHASHGDHWQGGDKAMGIPLHAIARQVNATTQLFHKHGTAVPDYYVCGHLHRGIVLPTGLGDVTINGGFPGLDNYALTGNFNPVDPTQTFFRMHPKYGKIATYQVQLKYAELGKPSYDLPTRFGCV